MRLQIKLEQARQTVSRLEKLVNSENMNAAGDSNQLLDEVIRRLKLKNDAALARALSVSPAKISSIRHQRMAIPSSMVIRVLEVTDLNIHDLNKLMTVTENPGKTVGPRSGRLARRQAQLEQARKDVLRLEQLIRSEAVGKVEPGHFIDEIIRILQVKNDAALGRVLDVPPPVISKIRHGRLDIGPTLLVRIHEATELSIHEIRKLMRQGLPQEEAIAAQA
jgi:plasmid maintenance system antidote protein VapI